jgi:hypothetical protein
MTMEALAETQSNFHAGKELEAHFTRKCKPFLVKEGKVTP